MSWKKRLEDRIRRAVASEPYPEHHWLDSPVSVSGMVQIASAHLERLATAIIKDEKVRLAVLDRPQLIDRWYLEAGVWWNREPNGYALALLGQRARSGLNRLPAWPPSVAFGDVAKALEETGDAVATNLIASQLKSARFSIIDGTDGEDGPVVFSTFSMNFDGISSVSFEVSASHPVDDYTFFKDTFDENGNRFATEHVRNALNSSKWANYWHAPSVALLVEIARDVDTDRRRPAIAIPATRSHHNVLSGMRDYQTNKKREKGEGLIRHNKGAGPDVEHTQIIMPPGMGSDQLLIPFDGSVNEALVATIRNWKSRDALPDWAAMLRLLSVEGGRSRRIKWILDQHLDALGYARKVRNDPDVRARHAANVGLFTRVELAAYRNGQERLRQALFTSIAKAERRVDGGESWSLEGAELEAHPFIWNGVRGIDGKVGKDWFPAPLDLAKIDYARRPYALSLGLLLPIRWRWAWKEKRDHLALSGRNFLSMCGIPYEAARPGRAWKRAEDSLGEVQRIDLLGRFEWRGEPWSLDGMIDLYPAQWMRDRTWNGLPSIEKPVVTLPPLASPMVTLPTKGAALAEWRKANKWSQLQLATRLKVSERTLRNAEVSKEGELPPSVAKALSKHR